MNLLYALGGIAMTIFAIFVLIGLVKIISLVFYLGANQEKSVTLSGFDFTVMRIAAVLSIVVIVLLYIMGLKKLYSFKRNTKLAAGNQSV